MNELTLSLILLAVSSIVLIVALWTKDKEYSSFWFYLLFPVAMVLSGSSFETLYELLDIGKIGLVVAMILFFIHLYLTVKAYFLVFGEVKPD